MPSRQTKRKLKDAERQNRSRGKRAILGLDLNAKQKTAEELDLEASLFGTLGAHDLPDLDGDSEGGQEQDANDDIENGIEDEQLFMIDVPIQKPTRQAEDTLSVGSSSDGASSSHLEAKQKIKKEGPVWVDPSDAALSISLASQPRTRKLRANAKEDVVSGTEYEAKLRQQHARLHPTPSWAIQAKKNAKRKRQEDDEDSADFLANTNAGLADKRSLKTLASGKLDIARLRDIAHEQGSKASMQTLAFHPSANGVLLTTSADRRLRLFSVDGITNPLLQSLHMPELPLTDAQFHPGGTSVLLTGNRPFFLCHDLISGQTSRSPANVRALATSGSAHLSPADRTLYRFSADGSRLAISGKRGYIHLLDFRSPQNIGHIGELKSNASLTRDLCWSPAAADDLYSVSADSEICVWDARMMRCRARWLDEGGFGTLGLGMDRGGRYFATSTSTGVVNVYDAEVAAQESSGLLSERRPLKTILNLTTSVDTMSFNAQSSILAIASNAKKDSMKLVHTASMTVFSNWPTANTPLGHVRSVAFSAKGNYLAIAGDKGAKALLYNIPHFT